MIKAIFMDFYGTAAMEIGLIAVSVIKDVFMEEIKRYSLHPAGTVTSEEAKYSKPRKEIFLYAFKKAGVSPEEVIHVGDSLEDDVKCPSSVGIRSIWLNRERKPVPAGVESIDSLLDLQKYL